MIQYLQPLKVFLQDKLKGIYNVEKDVYENIKLKVEHIYTIHGN
jgi:hypothetical protein